MVNNVLTLCNATASSFLTTRLPTFFVSAVSCNCSLINRTRSSNDLFVRSTARSPNCSRLIFSSSLSNWMRRFTFSKALAPAFSINLSIFSCWVCNTIRLIYKSFTSRSAFDSDSLSVFSSLISFRKNGYSSVNLLTNFSRSSFSILTSVIRLTKVFNSTCSLVISVVRSFVGVIARNIADPKLYIESETLLMKLFPTNNLKFSRSAFHLACEFCAESKISPASAISRLAMFATA